MKHRSCMLYEGRVSAGLASLSRQLLGCPLPAEVVCPHSPSRIRRGKKTKTSTSSPHRRGPRPLPRRQHDGRDRRTSVGGRWIAATRSGAVRLKGDPRHRDRWKSTRYDRSCGGDLTMCFRFDTDADPRRAAAPWHSSAAQSITLPKCRARPLDRDARLYDWHSAATPDRAERARRQSGDVSTAALLLNGAAGQRLQSHLSTSAARLAWPALRRNPRDKLALAAR